MGSLTNCTYAVQKDEYLETSLLLLFSKLLHQVTDLHQLITFIHLTYVSSPHLWTPLDYGSSKDIENAVKTLSPSADSLLNQARKNKFILYTSVNDQREAIVQRLQENRQLGPLFRDRQPTRNAGCAVDWIA